MNHKRILTKIEPLDMLLGGGFPDKGLVEISGEPNAGRSSLALNICETVVSEGGIAVYVDVDHRFPATYDPTDRDRFIVIQENDIDKVFGSIQILMKERAAHVIVLDSVPSLVFGDGKNDGWRFVGELKLRMNRLTSFLNDTLLIVVNQPRREGETMTVGSSAFINLCKMRVAIRSVTDEGNLRLVSVKVVRNMLSNHFGATSIPLIITDKQIGFSQEGQQYEWPKYDGWASQ